MTRHLLVAVALAGCAAPSASVVPAVEEAAGTTGTVSTPSPVSTPVSRSAPKKASRSRRTADPAGTGSHLNSTAYCETGLMANGHHTHRGAVAANRWPLGTRLRVSDSPFGPGTFTVEDRYGWGTSLDFATPGDCQLARAWGRRTILVEVTP